MAQEGRQKKLILFFRPIHQSAGDLGNELSELGRVRYLPKERQFTLEVEGIACLPAQQFFAQRGIEYTIAPNV